MVSSFTIKRGSEARFHLLLSKARIRVSNHRSAPKFLYNHLAEKALATSQSLYMPATRCLCKPTHFHSTCSFLLSLLLACVLSNLGYSHTSDLNSSRDGSLVLSQTGIVCLCLFNILWYKVALSLGPFWEGAYPLLAYKLCWRIVGQYCARAHLNKSIL